MDASTFTVINALQIGHRIKIRARNANKNSTKFKWKTGKAGLFKRRQLAITSAMNARLNMICTKTEYIATVTAYYIWMSQTCRPSVTSACRATKRSTSCASSFVRSASSNSRASLGWSFSGRRSTTRITSWINFASKKMSMKATSNRWSIKCRKHRRGCTNLATKSSQKITLTAKKNWSSNWGLKCANYRN